MLLFCLIFGRASQEKLFGNHCQMGVAEPTEADMWYQLPYSQTKVLINCNSKLFPVENGSRLNKKDLQSLPNS